MRFSKPRQLLLTFGILAAAAPAIAADGKAVYDKTCAMCHAAGIANAPKFGDKAAWAPRVATDQPTLITSVIKGKGAMPPKGGAADLSEDDIRAAVDHMLAAAR